MSICHQIWAWVTWLTRVCVCYKESSDREQDVPATVFLVRVQLQGVWVLLCTVLCGPRLSRLYYSHYNMIQLSDLSMPPLPHTHTLYLVIPCQPLTWCPIISVSKNWLEPWLVLDVWGDQLEPSLQAGANGLKTKQYPSNWPKHVHWEFKVVILTIDPLFYFGNMSRAKHCLQHCFGSVTTTYLQSGDKSTCPSVCSKILKTFIYRDIVPMRVRSLGPADRCSHRPE